METCVPPGPWPLCRGVTPALAPLLAAALVGCWAPQGDEELVVDPPVTRVVDDLPALELRPAFGERRWRRPVDARQAPGDPVSWYVVEQQGVITRVRPGSGGLAEEVLLDIEGLVSRRHNEEGLLGLAFDPAFDRLGHGREGAFYVAYSVEPGPSVRLSRFVLQRGAGTARGSSEEVLLEVQQPFRNHNGGGLAFGPDGYLYWSLGDGGFRGDPQGHAQDTSTLLGGILRLDVGPPGESADDHFVHGTDDDPGSPEPPYRIPADNPLVGVDGARAELWAWGLRNVWRFSFDRDTGEAWGADVGQDLYEWVHVLRAGGNHGWDLLEGFHRFELPVGQERPRELVTPVWEYPHDDGLSITGGFVYRGQALPELDGWYVFGDYATRVVWALRRTPEGVDHATLLTDTPLIASFAEGHDGELLLVGHEGFLFRIARAGD